MNDIAATLARGHALNHKNALEAVGALDDLQLRWRPARSNSIGFNLWHMARWAREGIASGGAFRPKGSATSRPAWGGRRPLRGAGRGPRAARGARALAAIKGAAGLRGTVTV